MFERYTEDARRTIFFARYEASQFGSSFIETEHLLLGVLRQDKDLVSRFLGGKLPGGPPPAAVPPEVMETEKRIKYIVHRMEEAIANQAFEKAKFYSNEERNEREKLRELHQKYNLHGAGEYQGPVVEAIRRQIVAHTAPREKVSTSVDLPLSHECKRVLGYGAEEAERMDQRHIGTGHLLLGLLREEKCFAADILHERGLRLSQVREEIARSVSPEGHAGGMRFGRVGAQAARMRSDSGWIVALQDAGRVVHLARHEAVTRHSVCIETADLLLALTHEKEVTERFPITADSVRQHGILTLVTASEKVSSEELPYSESFKLVCTYAIEEAARLGQRTGPSHLLLGILLVESCAAAKTLRDCGLTAAGVRAQLTPPPPPSSDPEQGRNYV